jgi:AraC-like DNA-binding protein
MRYAVHPPPEPLRDYVEHLWTVAVDGEEPPDLTLKFFVTCSPCIVFQHRDGRSAIARRTSLLGGEASNGRHPTAFIRGPITRPFQCLAEGAPIATGVELKPQALNTLFGIDVSELSDGMVELNRFSTDNLNEQLLNAENQHDHIEILSRFLRTKAEGLRQNDSLVTKSLRLIDESIGSLHVQDLLRRLNVSERQFERRFLRAVGVRPSLYLRITRFQEAVRLMKAERFERLSDMACNLGYTDQSHFIKDVKEFTGYTPRYLSVQVGGCMKMTQDRTLVRQRILIGHDTVQTAGHHKKHRDLARTLVDKP